jgi:hypothetical protein
MDDRSETAEVLSRELYNSILYIPGTCPVWTESKVSFSGQPDDRQGTA